MKKIALCFCLLLTVLSMASCESESGSSSSFGESTPEITKLGYIEDTQGLAEALGSGMVEVTFSR